MCPITKSAKKAIRKGERKRARNIIYKDKIKDLSKQVKNLVSNKKIEEAKKLLPQLYKAFDKAAKTGVIKKNNASRKKSRITKSIIKSQQ